MQNPDTGARAVLHYWFGEATETADVMAEKSSLWWKKDDRIDADIRDQFEPLLQQLSDGKLDHWKESARGRLALIVMADQFSRNMYRGTPGSFATDPIALSLAQEGIAAGVDRELRPVDRIFFYMPLMHAESIEAQQQSVRLFSELVEEASLAEQEKLRGNLDYAVQHRDIIARFGRFPHRNNILGRQSTAGEAAFLQQPGSSF